MSVCLSVCLSFPTLVCVHVCVCAFVCEKGILDTRGETVPSHILPELSDHLQSPALLNLAIPLEQMLLKTGLWFHTMRATCGILGSLDIFV